MATIARVAVSEYLRTGCEPDAKYVDVEIEERPAGNFDRARWQSAIQRWFLARSDRWNVWVLPEVRVQVSPNRFRVPDVTIIDRSLPHEQIITRPPIAVVEVLTPEGRVARILSKLQDYEHMGLKNILVVDPKDGSVWKFGHGGLSPSASGSLDATSCRLDWEQIRRYVAGE